MHGRPWSEQEVKFLRDNYPYSAVSWCANQLGRNIHSVYAKIKEVFPKTSQTHNNYLRKPEPYAPGLCHDCKKPTPTYRCPACKEKHLKKHRASMDGFAADETYSVLH